MPPSPFGTLILNKLQQALICIIITYLFPPLGPPGRETIISPVIPGSYSVRAIVTTTDERIMVSSITVVVPGGNACSAHLINRGVTVEGSSARVEFRGAGLGGRAAFVCGVNGRQDHPCECTLV